MKEVFEAIAWIPELGIAPGDVVTIRPEHPDNPLLVTRRHDLGALAYLDARPECLNPLWQADGSEQRAQRRPGLRSLMLRA